MLDSRDEESARGPQLDWVRESAKGLAGERVNRESITNFCYDGCIAQARQQSTDSTRPLRQCRLADMATHGAKDSLE